MPDDRISTRQLLTLLFAALLSPAIRLLPARTAAVAGTAAWLSALAALPAVLGLCWVLFALLRPAEEGVGLPQVFQQVLGKPLGKTVTALYLLWGLFLLCVNARLVALRFLATSYRNAPLLLFITTLLGVTLWLVRKPIRVLARVGEIFYLILAIGVGATLLFGAFQIEAYHVWPVWKEDIPGILTASVSVLGLMGYTVFAAVLAGHVRHREEDRRHALAWAGVFCGVLTALQLVCLGAFGPALIMRMDTPFFMMVKGIGIEGSFQRVESLVIALWVLSDLALLALLAGACSVLAHCVCTRIERKKWVWLIIPGALIGAVTLFPNVFVLEQIMLSIALPGNLIFGFLIPFVVLLVKKLRTKV